MQTTDAIRGRRTTKVFGPEPLERETIEQLLDLARWAPNHHLTNPWRFRVVGPRALERLKQAAGPEAAPKLDRAPTLIAVTCRPAEDPDEDFLAAGCAAYIVLLAAHDRGLSSYWRTPAVLRTPAGRAALGIPEDERIIGLLHLGPKRQEQAPPERAPLANVVRWLD
jgi:nitroreductase